MANISPAEQSHGIDLESALDFLNTLHPGHGRTDEQHQRDEHLALPADAAMWFLEQGLIHCTGTIRLHAGQLTFQGLTTTAPTKQLAITGGTGRSQGVGGEATLVELGDGTCTLTVRLRR